jgi:hypothetical protein
MLSESSESISNDYKRGASPYNNDETSKMDKSDTEKNFLVEDQSQDGIERPKRRGTSRSHSEQLIGSQ